MGRIGVRWSHYARKGDSTLVRNRRSGCPDGLESENGISFSEGPHMNCAQTTHQVAPRRAPAHTRRTRRPVLIRSIRSDNMSIQEYIEEHALGKKVEDVINAAVKAKAPEPISFMVRVITAFSNRVRRSVSESDDCGRSPIKCRSCTKPGLVGHRVSAVFADRYHGCSKRTSRGIASNRTARRGQPPAVDRWTSGHR